MGTVRMAWNNYAASTNTTVVASSTTTALPVGNIQNQQPTKVYRSASAATPVNIDFTFQSAYAVQQVCIKNHNFTSGVSMSLIGATNSDFTPQATSVGLTYFDGIMLAEFPSEQTYQFWRLRVDDSGNPNNYIEIGHAFIGPYDEFTFPDFATVIRLIDPTVIKTAYGGPTHYYKKDKYKVVEFGMDMVQQADRRYLDTLFNTLGIGTSLYLFLDPTNVRDNEDASNALDGLHRFTYYGVFTGNYSINHFGIDWHSIDTIGFRELV